MTRYKCQGKNGITKCEKVGGSTMPLRSRISRFRNKTDRGLGDTVSRIFAKFGGGQFKWIFKKLGVNCGCDDRQAALNKMFPYDDTTPTE